MVSDPASSLGMTVAANKRLDCSGGRSKGQVAPKVSGEEDLWQSFPIDQGETLSRAERNSALGAFSTRQGSYDAHQTSDRGRARDRMTERCVCCGGEGMFFPSGVVTEWETLFSVHRGVE